MVVTKETAAARRENKGGGFYSYEMGHECKRGMKGDLYRAILRGDIEAAEDAMNLLAMVGIDVELIQTARQAVRMRGGM